MYALILGYIACYAPFSLLAHRSGLAPLAVLPGVTLGCAAALWAGLLATGLWRRVDWLGPAALSGLATSAIILSSTAAYAVPGAPVVVVVAAMKGGVLAMAPILDLLAGRRRAPVLPALLALLGLAVALRGAPAAPPAACGLAMGLYLAGYAAKLRLAERVKGRGADLVGWAVTDSAVAVTAALAVVAAGAAASADLRAGWASAARPDLLGAGLLSQGTGVFGTLILLAPRPHGATVTLNRAAAVVAGAISTLAGGRWLTVPEVAGVALIVAAVLILPRRAGTSPAEEKNVKKHLSLASAILALALSADAAAGCPDCPPDKFCCTVERPEGNVKSCCSRTTNPPPPPRACVPPPRRAPILACVSDSDCDSGKMCYFPNGKRDAGGCRKKTA